MLAARYILCTALDEAAAGHTLGWRRDSGPGTACWSSFHDETDGGEKVFQLMAKLAEQPDQPIVTCSNSSTPRSRSVSRAVTACSRGGAAQLEAVRERLAQIVSKERGAYAQPLAQHWQTGATRKRPYRLVAAAVGHRGLRLRAAARRLPRLRQPPGPSSDPVFAKVQSLRSVVQVPLPMPVAQPAPPRLASLLKPDIDSGTVVVKDLRDRSIVTLRGDGLFQSGGTAVSRDRVALLKRVAAPRPPPSAGACS